MDRPRICAECKKWEMGETWGSGSGEHGVAVESRGWCHRTRWRKPRWNYEHVCPSFDRRPNTGFIVSGQGYDEEAFQEIADNMREMAEDSQRDESREEPVRDKVAEYAEVVGRRFRPTFSSPIDFFEIRGYDAERDMVLTTAHPKEGEPFDDEIEERYLMGAFETGEYEPVEKRWMSDEAFRIFANPYFDLYQPPKPREQKFHGPCCNRCRHRFGTTSNKAWCEGHWQGERCYRFKL